MRYTKECKWNRTIALAASLILYCGLLVSAQTGGFLPDALEGRWQLNGNSGAITFVKTPSGWTGTYEDFRQSFPPLKNIEFDPATGRVSFTSLPGSLGKPAMDWVGTIFRNQQSNGCSIIGTLEFDYLDGKTPRHYSGGFGAGSTFHGKAPVGKGYSSRCFSKVIPGVTPVATPGPIKSPSPKPVAKETPLPPKPVVNNSFWGNWKLSSGGRIGQPDERKAAYVGTITFSPGTGKVQASYRLGGDQGTLEDVVISGSVVRFKRRLPGFYQNYEGTMTSEGRIDGTFDHKGTKFRWWATR